MEFIFFALEQLLSEGKYQRLTFAQRNLPQLSEWPETYSVDFQFQERIILESGITFLPTRSATTEVQLE